jgi:hypothetical protein
MMIFALKSVKEVREAVKNKIKIEFSTSVRTQANQAEIGNI